MSTGVHSSPRLQGKTFQLSVVVLWNPQLACSVCISCGWVSLKCRCALPAYHACTEFGSNVQILLVALYMVWAALLLVCFPKCKEITAPDLQRFACM